MQGAVATKEVNREEFSRLTPQQERQLAMDCARKGGTACPAMNGANEEAVAMYLRDEIGFYDIYELVSKALEAVPFVQNPTLEEILEADRAARAYVRANS